MGWVKNLVPVGGSIICSSNDGVKNAEKERPIFSHIRLIIFYSLLIISVAEIFQTSRRWAHIGFFAAGYFSHMWSGFAHGTRRGFEALCDICRSGASGYRFRSLGLPFGITTTYHSSFAFCATVKATSKDFSGMGTAKVT